jgi:hypothetical protein
VKEKSGGLPSKYQLLHAKFDALSNRALYSREPLQQFWNDTVKQLKGMRPWNIHPGILPDQRRERRSSGKKPVRKFPVESRSLKVLRRVH